MALALVLVTTACTSELASQPEDLSTNASTAGTAVSTTSLLIPSTTTTVAPTPDPPRAPLTQDLDRLAAILEPLVEVDEEVLMTDAIAFADAFGVSVKKSRIRLLYEFAFESIRKQMREQSLADELVIVSVGPIEGPIRGHLWFKAEPPPAVQTIIHEAGMDELIVLHGHARFTQSKWEEITIGISEAVADLGFAHPPVWTDGGTENLIVLIEPHPKSPDLSDTEIIGHLENKYVPPLEHGSIRIIRARTD